MSAVRMKVDEDDGPLILKEEEGYTMTFTPYGVLVEHVDSVNAYLYPWGRVRWVEQS